MGRPKRAAGEEGRRRRAPARVKVELSTCRALIPLDTAAVQAQYLQECEACVADYLASEKALLQHENDEAEYCTWLQVALGALQTELHRAKEEVRAACVAYRRARERAGIPMSRVEDMMDALQGGIAFEDARGEDGAAWGRGGMADDDDDELQAAAEMRAQNVASTAMFFRMERSDVQQRIKELYRGLCRALHPDAGGGVPAGLEWLWDDVQAAYQQGDAIRLLSLETRVQMMQGTYCTLPGAGDVIDFMTRMRIALRVLEDDLAEAKASPAWRFSQWDAAKKKRVLKRAQQEVREDIEDCRDAVEEYEERLRAVRAHEQRERERAAQRQKEEERRRRRYEEACAREGDTPPPRPRRRRGAAVAGDNLQPEFSF